MTAQAPERIEIDGEDHALFSCPLDEWFEFSETKSPFRARSTALWRGYVGRWAIEDGRLYLVALEGLTRAGTTVGLEALFPGQQRVFAHWFSGTLRIPIGRLLTYVHGGFSRCYERDRFIEVDAGVVTDSREVNNGEAKPGAPESKGPAALVAFLNSPAARRCD